MRIDRVNRKAYFDSPGERKQYLEHHAEFGPDGKGEHPDDCAHCAERGWETWDDEYEVVVEGEAAK